MNDTVAHVSSSRPSKPRQGAKPKVEVARVDATSFSDAASAKTYGLANIEAIREFIPRLIAGQVLATKTGDELREMAEYAATDLDGAEEALVALAGFALGAAPQSLGASRAPTHHETALTCTGRIVPLRAAVDEVIANIDGIVRECRAAIDKAAAMHVYVVGNARRMNNDAFCAPSEDPDGDYNEAMAEAVGALQCLLGYVDQLRPESVRTRRAIIAAESETNDLNAAAE